MVMVLARRAIYVRGRPNQLLRHCGFMIKAAGLSAAELAPGRAVEYSRFVIANGPIVGGALRWRKMKEVAKMIFAGGFVHYSRRWFKTQTCLGRDAHAGQSDKFLNGAGQKKKKKKKEKKNGAICFTHRGRTTTYDEGRPLYWGGKRNPKTSEGAGGSTATPGGARAPGKKRRKRKEKEKEEETAGRQRCRVLARVVPRCRHFTRDFIGETVGF